MFSEINEIKQHMKGVLEIRGNDAVVLDELTLQNVLIDDLVYTAVFCENPAAKEFARWLIRRVGAVFGIIPSSIQSLYEEMGKGHVKGFSVPAINIRGITYYAAQAVFRAAAKMDAGAFIFEIARSEIQYTEQRPDEYTTVIIAAAIKTGFRGPVFLQGDHFQINRKKYSSDPDKEKAAVTALIREAIEGGFYNIDIDASTTVDLNKSSIKQQQEDNYGITAEFTALIRELEPAGITVSVGGEIGEIGDKNTTVEEFVNFMEGYREVLKTKGNGSLKGISKISIQTGTTHGGVPLPDGTVADVKLDFDVLKNISRVARTEYGLSGAVQHGASTLPQEAFDKFVETGTSEIHLATGFQNIIYDSNYFPAALREEIYDYLKKDLQSEKKESDTEEQFIYKTRKKGFGRFKKELWGMPPEILRQIGEALEKQFHFLFKKLNIVGTKAVVTKLIHPVDVPGNIPSAIR